MTPLAAPFSAQREVASKVAAPGETPSDEPSPPQPTPPPPTGQTEPASTWETAARSLITDQERTTAGVDSSHVTTEPMVAMGPEGPMGPKTDGADVEPGPDGPSGSRSDESAFAFRPPYELLADYRARYGEGFSQVLPNDRRDPAPLPRLFLKIDGTLDLSLICERRLNPDPSSADWEPCSTESRVRLVFRPISGSAPEQYDTMVKAVDPYLNEPNVIFSDLKLAPGRIDIQTYGRYLGAFDLVEGINFRAIRETFLSEP